MRTSLFVVLAVALASALACSSGSDGSSGGGGAVSEIEPNDTPGTATPLPAGGGVAIGAISTAVDVDYYSVVVPAGMVAALHAQTFDASGVTCAGIDTMLRLYGPTGTLLVTNSDGGVVPCSLIDVQLPPGTYTLAVSAQYATTPFNYLLAASLTPTGIPVVAETEPNDDGSVATYTNDFSSANANGPFTSDVVVTGAISPAGDEDVFAVTNTTAAPVAVHFETFEGGIGLCPTIDTYLYLRDAAGTLLTQDDDSGVGLCSAITYAIPAGGTIYAQVTDFGDNGAIPSYMLRIDFP